MLDFIAQTPALASLPAAWSLAIALPRGFSGESLHRLALQAMHAGALPAALALYERAGLAYRREVEVLALARMRVHEMMARVRANRGADAVALALSTERRLARLERIESLAPPFALVDAHRVLATWWPGESAARREAVPARAA